MVSLFMGDIINFVFFQEIMQVSDNTSSGNPLKTHINLILEKVSSLKVIQNWNCLKIFLIDVLLDIVFNSFCSLSAIFVYFDWEILSFDVYICMSLIQGLHAGLHKSHKK